MATNANEQVKHRKVNKESNKNGSQKTTLNDQDKQLSNEKVDFEKLDAKSNSYYLTRIVLLRFLAFIYAVAFLVALHQNEHLLGKNGLKPANQYLKRIYQQLIKKPVQTNDTFEILKQNFELFMKLPTLYWFFDWPNSIDLLLNTTALAGLTISLFIIYYAKANSILMLLLWLLYHSIVNVGQTWYSFGWESQLLESGFIGIFLVPIFSMKKISAKSPPNLVPILCYRWLIFRIMIGAGLIKVRGDECWKDFTCMNYHYETQPVPNPLSYYMHKEPEVMHKFEVLSNHLIELIFPFLILIPFRPFRLIGGLIQIFFQIVLIISGNLSFLNWLTILPSLACLDDKFLQRFFSRKTTLKQLLEIDYFSQLSGSDLNKQLNKKTHLIKCRFKQTLNFLLLALIAYLSLPVVMNLLSSKQAMNTSFDTFRLVNSYGAFGSITKQRHEVIFKGTHSTNLNENNVVWKEYEFKCKPGNLKQRPCIISPYHYRLDWLMWFAAFQTYEYNPWLLSLSMKFLLNDEHFTRQMIRFNPFDGADKPPKYVKADLYLYNYESAFAGPWLSNASSSVNWWRRKFVRNYLPPVTIEHLQEYVKNDLGWSL